MSLRAAVAVPVIALTVGACAPGAEQPSVHRFDENGVEVVVSERPAWADGTGWRLSSEPELVIGEKTDDPRYLFSAIFGGRLLGFGNGLGPFRLPDGQIVAGDQRSTEVRFFDANGQIVRAAVGPGQGPKEMGGINELHHCALGMLVAVDIYRDELVVLDAEGRVNSRFFYSRDVDRPLYGPLACNRNGQWLAMDWGDELGRVRPDEVSLYRLRVHFWLLDPEGFVLLDFGEFPGGERLTTGRGSSPHPLGKIPARALGPDAAYIGTADGFEIESWALDGGLRQRWRRPTPDLTAEPNDVDYYAADEFPDTWLAEEVRASQRRFAPLPLPESYPAYTRFVLDATGHLWVEHFRTPRQPQHLWSVFDPSGVWLGEIEVLPTFEITDVGEDYVLGVYRDELDEQSIRLYRLIRD